MQTIIVVTHQAATLFVAGDDRVNRSLAGSVGEHAGTDPPTVTDESGPEVEFWILPGDVHEGHVKWAGGMRRCSLRERIEPVPVGPHHLGDAIDNGFMGYHAQCHVRSLRSPFENLAGVG